MRDRSLPWRVLALCVVMFASSGCAFIRGSAAGTAFVERDQQHLRLPSAEDALAFRPIAYLSPYTYVEYARARSGDGRSEALLYRTRGLGTALDLDPRHLNAFTRQWVFNSGGATLTWQQPRPARFAPTGIHYRRYQLHRPGEAGSRDCVAFLKGWDFQSLDPLHRPGRGYFGYTCRPPGVALTTADVAAYLQRIETATPSLPDFYIGQRVPRDPQALAQARGQADVRWGITAFPYDRTRHYPLGGSHNGGS